MEKLKNLFFSYQKYILFIIIILLVNIILLYIFWPQKEIVIKEKIKQDVLSIVEEDEEIEEFYVDIKGAISKPGVYKVETGMIINDVVKLAGGLLKTASTKNINLSKKLNSEMVIIISTKTELKNILSTNDESETTCTSSESSFTNCLENEKISIVENKETSNDSQKKEESSTQKLISLNTATLEELMTLEGIGTAKAQSIINYRQEVGVFVKIEDVMNVSGIGESIFAKIKESITV